MISALRQIRRASAGLWSTISRATPSVFEIRSSPSASCRTIDGWIPRESSSIAISRGAAASAGQRELLLQPAGQLAGGLPPAAPQLGEELERVDRDPAGAGQPGEPEVLGDGEAREDAAVVGHQGEAATCEQLGAARRQRGAVDPHGAAVALGEPEDRPQERGLAHPVAAEERDRLALAEREGDLVDHSRAGVAGGEALDLEQHQVTPR